MVSFCQAVIGNTTDKKETIFPLTPNSNMSTCNFQKLSSTPTIFRKKLEETCNWKCLDLQTKVCANRNGSKFTLRNDKNLLNVVSGHVPLGSYFGSGTNWDRCVHLPCLLKFLIVENYYASSFAVYLEEYYYVQGNVIKTQALRVLSFSGTGQEVNPLKVKELLW